MSTAYVSGGAEVGESAAVESGRDQRPKMAYMGFKHRPRGNFRSRGPQGFERRNGRDYPANSFAVALIKFL